MSTMEMVYCKVTRIFREPCFLLPWLMVPNKANGLKLYPQIPRQMEAKL